MFPAFVCANNIKSLVISFFGVNIFNPFPFFTSGKVGGKSVDFSSIFVLSHDSSLSLFLVVPNNFSFSDQSS